MGFKFTDAGRYPYRPGGFFLGIDEHGREVGISTERHLITVAGAGSGKGATLIVPNLKRWRGSCVVIDPKGENATITAGDRERMGQMVGVLDPYEIAKGRAAELRCAINPMALLKPESRTISADLEALGDGLIRRHDPKHARWDDAAASILAGCADFVLTVCPPEQRNLRSVRGLLLLPEDDLKAMAGEMVGMDTPAGLARQAGALLQSKFSDPESVEAGGFGIALQETRWIDDKAFADMLGGGDLPPFDIASLKAGTGSLYLCIRADHLTSRGQFLRLFVRMGLATMMQGLAAHDGGARCLFLLDEFHSLGKLDLVVTAAGLMRGYGVHLWPFLQDLGQLEGMYGPNEMETFFENADAHIFFGNSGKKTLRDISARLGNLQPNEITTAPPQRKMGWNSKNEFLTYLDQAAAVDHDNERAHYEHAMRQAGRPRLTPEEVAELVGKKDGDKVARSAIVFAKGGDVLNVRLQPYFAAGAEPEIHPAQRGWLQVQAGETPADRDHRIAKRREFVLKQSHDYWNPSTKPKMDFNYIAFIPCIISLIAVGLGAIAVIRKYGWQFDHSPYFYVGIIIATIVIGWLAFCISRGRDYLYQFRQERDRYRVRYANWKAEQG